MKTCCRCSTPQPLENYHSAGTGKKRGACRTCINKSRNIRETARRYRRKAELAASRGNKCELCGLEHTNPGFFDWHHKDPALKEGKISEMVVAGEAKLRKEAEKCLMLCPNCHRKEHLN